MQSITGKPNSITRERLSSPRAENSDARCLHDTCQSTDALVQSEEECLGERTGQGKLESTPQRVVEQSLFAAGKNRVPYITSIEAHVLVGLDLEFGPRPRGFCCSGKCGKTGASPHFSLSWSNSVDAGCLLSPIPQVNRGGRWGPSINLQLCRAKCIKRNPILQKVQACNELTESTNATSARW